jgi:hypothetical protein
VFNTFVGNGVLDVDPRICYAGVAAIKADAELGVTNCHLNIAVVKN